MSVVGCILSFGKTRASAPALIEGDRTISYGELAGLLHRTAGHLAAQGLRHGDRVGLCLKDTADHLIAMLGAALLGAIPVSLDWRGRPSETARFVDALDLTCLLAEPDVQLAGGTVLRMNEDWHREVARAPDWHSAGDWHDPFLISASSGSTGAPKFTSMTHRQYYFAIVGMFELMALAGHHRFLCTLPLYYSGGRNSCMTHLLRGDCVVLYPNLYSPAEYLDVVARQRITVAALVPTGVRQLLAASGSGPALLPGLAALFCTGAPLHAQEKRLAARNLTPKFQERYGTAETLAISVLRPEDFAERPDSVGQPHSLVELAVADENDRPLPSGATGVLRIRGPGMGSPLAGHGAQPNFRGGWYYPGEIARLDAAGYIFLQGRTSDVIMRNGAKIYPAEIEAVLLEHPGVLEAAVLGRRGADNEETVIAFLVPRSHLPTGELIAHCRAHLTAHKVPRHFRVLARLPRNTAGKLDKAALAYTLEAERRKPG